MISCNNNGGNQQQSASQNIAATTPIDNAQATAPTNQQAIPDAITEFIQKQFPGSTVAQVDTDSENGGLEYDITLNDGTEIDFDTNNQWKKIDCKVKAVPSTFIPEPIASYVKTNHQSLPITQIEKNRIGFDIELNNGLELKFDANGKFIGMDN